MPNRGHRPVRTCIGCRERALKPELVRLVRSPGGVLVVDPTGRATGRGAYLHRRDACVQAARKRRLEIPSV